MQCWRRDGGSLNFGEMVVTYRLFAITAFFWIKFRYGHTNQKYQHSCCHCRSCGTGSESIFYVTHSGWVDSVNYVNEKYGRNSYFPAKSLLNKSMISLGNVMTKTPPIVKNSIPHIKQLVKIPSNWKLLPLLINEIRKFSCQKHISQ